MQKVKVKSFKVCSNRSCLSLNLVTPLGECVSGYDTCMIQNFGIPCPCVNYPSRNDLGTTPISYFNTCNYCAFSLENLLSHFL